MPSKLKKKPISLAILLVGAGKMGGALLRGWVVNKLGPIAIVETAPSEALRKYAKLHRVPIHKTVEDVDPRALKICVVALKPQILKTEAARLAPFAKDA